MTFWSTTGPQLKRPGGIFWRFVFHAYMRAQLPQVSAAISGQVANFLGQVVTAEPKPTTALAGVMQPKGSLADLLRTPVTAASGTQTDSGVAAAALQLVKAALTGSQAQQGTAATTLIKSLSNVAGAQVQPGEIYTDLVDHTSALQGTELPQGTIAALVGLAVSLLTGGQTQSGAIQTTAFDSASSLAGIQAQSGTAAVSAKQAATLLAGAQTQSGLIASPLPKTVTTLTGAQIQTGTIATLEPGAATAISALSVANAESGLVATQLPTVLPTSLVGEQDQTGLIAPALTLSKTDVEALQAQSGTAAVALPLPLQTNVVAAQAQLGGIGVSMLQALVNVAGTDITSPTFLYAAPGGTSKATNGATTVTFTAVIPTGTNGVIIGVHSGTNNSWGTPTVKLGTVTATVLLSDYNYYVLGGTISLHFSIFYILSPTTGSQTVTVTSGSPGFGYTARLAADLIAYQYVSSFGTAVTTNGLGTTASHTVSGSAGTTLFNMLAYYGNTSGNTFTGYNQTSHYINTNDGNQFPSLIGEAPGASSVTFSATLAASDHWGSVVVPISP